MRAYGHARRRAARATYSLPRSELSARWARHLTAAYLNHGCGEKVSRDQVDDATLVVSELVTNATRHGRSGCRLQLSVDRGRVTVEVHDSSPLRPRFPTGEATDVMAEGGRGMTLVRELSRRLSILATPGGGKTVQAVLLAC
ncbi:ATP-binding protein [Streptomyces liangshanensis]|uniref:ATP-binding protein n=1 Tax=Streptomyces liangshanensis TaxID=2717324 RepID=A0A6G9H706_9ACTN|nr:ATP-binding protein [Streptomyces liangshanensis]QIQ06335.1 ATP-binding protein [Streptomyces liangshanensis]